MYFIGILELKARWHCLPASPWYGGGLIYGGCYDTVLMPIQKVENKHDQTEQTVRRDLDDVVMTLT